MSRFRRPGWLLAGGALAALLALAAIGFLPADRTQRGADRDRGDSLAERGYLDPSACVGCHQEIGESFRKTGMGRSFAPANADAVQADFERNNVYIHPPSRRSYRMHRRGDEFFMRRSQVGFDGAETNVYEARVDYVIGSGYKAQTFLSRTAQGELVQLPVAWYAEDGGFWAMNPGYDRPDHDGFRRRVQYDCMFCHNAYPEAPAEADLPDAEPIVYGKLPGGIDCQRCHGPGRDHLQAIADGAEVAQVREAIVHPAKLDPARQLEICLQCHLQSTSFRLPYAILRSGRGVFSYQPGEPLGDYIVHFDHPPGAGYDDKFEIAHAAYRLLQSPCYQQGGLTCTKCHDPHHELSRDAADYRAVCLDCHRQRIATMANNAAHPAESSDCLECHMPQRRTDDVVHVVMTDHNIQRRKPKSNLLTARKEIRETAANAYRGVVAPYYPFEVPAPLRDRLDVAVAQVKAGANLEQGLPRLEALLEEFGKAPASYSFELAEAYRRSGRNRKALVWYEAALERTPGFLACLRSYGMALAEAGRARQAEQVLRRALKRSPEDSRTLHNLGLTLLQAGRAAEAAAFLQRSCRIQPDAPATHNALASALYESGNREAAEAAFREAIRIQPDYALARANLARLLAENGERREAEWQMQRAQALQASR